MNLSRRGFFKATGAALATTMAFELSSQTQAFASESKQDWKLVNTEEYTNICCYCAGGCGSLLSVRDGELVNPEGDPEHPINEGSLCAKGAGIYQTTEANDRRLKKVLYRAPYGDKWEEKDWDFAIDRIARHLKEERDAGFVKKNAKGQTSGSGGQSSKTCSTCCTRHRRS